MFLIFNPDRVFRVCVPDEKIKDEMAKDNEVAIQVEKFQTPSMPLLDKDDDNNDVVKWVSREEFEAIRNPPQADEDTEMDSV